MISIAHLKNERNSRMEGSEKSEGEKKGERERVKAQVMNVFVNISLNSVPGGEKTIDLQLQLNIWLVLHMPRVKFQILLSASWPLLG